MGQKIQLVIFDLDGTLVDAYQAVAGSVNYTLAQTGRAPVDDKAIKRAVGWGPRYLVGTFVDREDLDRALSIYRQHHARALKSGTKWLPGARELIEALDGQGYRLAIASNRPTRFTHIILKHLKAERAFDHVLCADKVAEPKPAGEMLEKILAKFSLSPEEALYVGDMTVDVETGHAAGVRTIAVLTGSSSREEVAACKPLAIIDHIKEAAGILEDLQISGKTSGDDICC
ncbi:MAG: HAD-IIIA family hydrolase [Candidatus Omnitrophica bacterium]|nr:HAD-IIIA family hydrolase [Candidatus Omnitrophota bacterium]